MRFRCTSIVGVDARLQFISGQDSLRFQDRALAVDPFRFDRVEPGAFRRQVARQDAHTSACLFDDPMMVPNPPTNGLARVPRRGIPDLDPGPDACGRELGATPREKLRRQRTNGLSCGETNPDLLGELGRAA